MLSAWAVAAVLGTTLIAVVEYDLDLTSVISVVISCLGNTGPALEYLVRQQPGKYESNIDVCEYNNDVDWSS